MPNSDQSSQLPGKKLPPSSPKDADENSLKSPVMKQFMSPTISTASKANYQPSRKKILGERSESPIHSFKDGEENLLTNQETGRADADNLKKAAISSKQFMSPLTKSTASKANRPVSITSSPRLLNFDSMNANEEFGEEADDWSPFSYDPVRNYLVPRPQFLRYRSQRLGLLEPSTKKETEPENEEEDSGSGDEFDDGEEFDEAEMEGSSICSRVLQFVLVLTILVLSTAYITAMNDEQVGVDPSPNYAAAIQLHIQEISNYPVAFVSRLEVNGSWFSSVEDVSPSPSPAEIVKPLDEGKEKVEGVMKEEIPEGEEVSLEEVYQEEEEEGDRFSFQEPLFLPLQPASGEVSYDYIKLDNKLPYDFEVENRLFQARALIGMAVFSTLVLVVLLLISFGGKSKLKKAAAQRNASLLPRSSGSDSQPPPSRSEAPSLPGQVLVGALIPERRTNASKSSGSPVVETDGMGRRSTGGGMKSKQEKKASHIHPEPAATVASASRNSSTTKSDRKTSSHSSSKTRTNEGGEGKAKKSAAAAGTTAATTTTATTPVRRSERIAGIR